MMLTDSMDFDVIYYVDDVSYHNAQNSCFGQMYSVKKHQ